MKNKTKGFTLVEVIVVISILMIFAGFMIPKIVGYQDKAKKMKAINIGKQIQSALMSCYAEGNIQITKAEINELTNANISEITLGGVATATATDAAKKNADNQISIDKDYIATFVSDGNSYTLLLNVSSNSVIIRKGETVIYKEVT